MVSRQKQTSYRPRSHGARTTLGHDTAEFILPDPAKTEFMRYTVDELPETDAVHVDDPRWDLFNPVAPDEFRIRSRTFERCCTVHHALGWRYLYMDVHRGSVFLSHLHESDVIGMAADVVAFDWNRSPHHVGERITVDVAFASTIFAVTFEASIHDRFVFGWREV